MSVLFPFGDYSLADAPSLPVPVYVGVTPLIVSVGPFARTAAPKAYYIIGKDDSLPTALRAVNSADPETKNFGGSVLKTGFTTAVLGLSAFQVGDIIHVAVTDGTAGTAQATKYVTYNMANNTWGTTETVAAAADVAASGNPGDPAIVVRADGQPVVFYNGPRVTDGTTLRQRVYYSRRTGVNTWTAGVRVDANTAHDTNRTLAALGSADRVHFIWNNSNTGGHNQRHLTSANVLGAVTTATLATMPMSDIISMADGANVRHIAVSGSGALTFISADDPVMTPIVSGSLFGGGTGGIRGVDSRGTAYVFFVTSTGLYFKKSSDFGATWSGPAAGTFAASGLFVNTQERGLSKNQHVYVRGNNVVFPYAAAEGSGWRYSEVPLHEDKITLTVTAEAFALTGQTATFTYTERTITHYTLTATPAALALSLKSATLRAGYRILVQPSLPAAPGGVPAGATAHIDFIAGTAFVQGTGAVGIETLVGHDPALAGTPTGYNPAFHTPYGYDVYANDGVDVLAFLGALRMAVVGGGSVIVKFQSRPDEGIGWDTEEFNIAIQNVGPTRNFWIASDWDYLMAGWHTTLDQMPGVWTISPDGGVINVVGFTIRASSKFEWAGNDLGILSYPITDADTPPANPMSAAYMDAFGPVASITAYPYLTTAELKAKTAPVLDGAPDTTGEDGEFKLTGQDISVRFGHKLTTGVATVLALTGRNVTLRRGAKVAATAGAYTFTWRTATLRYGHKLQAGVGVRLIGSQNVLLTYASTAKRLDALPRAFTLTGRTAILRYPYRLQVTAGAFTLTGRSAALRTGYRLLALKGNYALTGRSVNLTYVPRPVMHFVLTATVRAFTATGSYGVLRLGAGLRAAPGAINLTGQPIRLVRGRTLKTAPAGFNITGQDTGLIYYYRMSAEVTAFNVPRLSAGLHRSPTLPGDMAFGVRVDLRRW